MDVQLKRGLLEICVLAAMLHQDTYGYKLIKDISPYIEISESTLYPILKRLENANSVTVYSVEHSNRLRRYYKITDNGKKRIHNFLEDWESMMRVYDFIKEAYENEEKGFSEESV